MTLPASLEFRRRSLAGEAWQELRALVRYRPLVRHLVATTLATERVGTAFGYLWWLLHPLLLMAAYVVLVDVMLRQGQRNFPLFVLAALLAWKYSAAGARDAMAVTLSRERQMRQVAFPRSVLPLAAVLAETARFAFGLLVLLVGALPFGIFPHYTLPFVLLVLAVQLPFTLGIAYVLSALNVFFRDVQQASQHVFTLWFYLSPGLYPASAVPEGWGRLFALNPFTTLFTNYRAVLLDHARPDFSALLWLGLFSLGLLVAGFLVFVRLAPSFAKVN